DGGEGEDDGFHKTMGAICNPPSTPKPISYEVGHELREFMKSGMESISTMSQGTSFPLPKPQPGPSRPRPASPTGYPVGTPHQPVNIPKKSVGRWIVDSLNHGKLEEVALTLVKASLRTEDEWTALKQKLRETIYAEFVEAINENNVDQCMEAMKTLRQRRKGSFLVEH